MSGSEEEEYVDALGVVTALERTCELEAKLRQAIQDTHPLTTTLDWDFNSADREREALLAISEQLEYLEDKLREYRFLEPAELENKAVLLGQLDAVRRELVEVVDRFLPHVVFGKDAVRAVLAFAQVADDGAGEDDEESEEQLEGQQRLQHGQGEGEEEHEAGLTDNGGLTRRLSGGSSMGGFASEIEPEEVQLGPGGVPRRSLSDRARRDTSAFYDAAASEPAAGLIPAVRRSTGALQRPPRYPTHQQQQQQQGGGGQGNVLREQGQQGVLHGKQHGPPAASPKRPSSLQAGTASSPTSLHQQHTAQLAYMQQQQSPTRSAFLQHHQHQHRLGDAAASHLHPLAANVVPGAASGSSSPGAAATATALRSATATASWQGRRQQEEEEAAGRLASAGAAGTGSGNGGSGDSYSFSQPVAHAVSCYAPSSCAASEGAPSSRQSPQTLGQSPPTGAAVHAAAAGAPAPLGGSNRPLGAPGASRTFLLSRLNRAQTDGGSGSGGSTTGSRRKGEGGAGSRYGVLSRVSDEDIYGALDERGIGRPSSIMNPSPRQYGGFVKIRERPSQAEQDAAEPVPGPRSPIHPRIYGENAQDSESWEVSSEIQAASHAAILSLDPPAALPRPGRYQERPARAASVYTASPPRSARQVPYSSGGIGAAGRAPYSLSSVRGADSVRGGSERGGSGGRSLLGKLTSLVFTGAAAAAAVVVAQRAGPIVVQRGQEAASEVARRVQEQQQQLSARRQASQQRKRERDAVREQQQQEAKQRAQIAAQAAAQAQAWQQQAAKASAVDVPPPLPPPRAAPGNRMADLPQRSPAGNGGMADLPRRPAAASSGRMADQPPAHRRPVRVPAAAQKPPVGSTDPLPPFLAAAAAAAAAASDAPRRGSQAGAPGSRQAGRQRIPTQHGQLFPAMPPPDVSASMG
ncbi:hypothetical protein D9Q98_006338 [Chlorella vulgaris]|uniref:Uncharacterized protein n=1 Tax=Chlorella vulgaris TaxID=3077 RepID=A0A9D4YUZ6_CHLVU|nr:hypothetical protein D9Q98_006338 [Chlorella vulgaris]